MITTLIHLLLVGTEPPSSSRRLMFAPAGWSLVGVSSHHGCSWLDSCWRSWMDHIWDSQGCLRSVTPGPRIQHVLSHLLCPPWHLWGSSKAVVQLSRTRKLRSQVENQQLSWAILKTLPQPKFIGRIIYPIKVWEIKPTSPNGKNGLGATRYSGKQGFNDSLARSGVWWAGKPRTFRMGFLSPSSCKALSQFLIGMSNYRVNNLPKEVTWICFSPFVWIFLCKYPDGYYISRLSL